MSLGIGGIGDLVAISKLLKEVYVSLEQYRDATEDYQCIARELESVHRALQPVLAIQDISTLTTHLNPIIEQARRLETYVLRIRNKISLYDSALGTSARNKIYHKPWLKTKWILRMGPNIAKYRHGILTECEALLLLLTNLNLVQGGLTHCLLRKKVDDDEILYSRLENNTNRVLETVTHSHNEDQVALTELKEDSKALKTAITSSSSAVANELLTARSEITSTLKSIREEVSMLSLSKIAAGQANNTGPPVRSLGYIWSLPPLIEKVIQFNFAHQTVVKEDVDQTVSSLRDYNRDLVQKFASRPCSQSLLQRNSRTFLSSETHLRRTQRSRRRAQLLAAIFCGFTELFQSLIYFLPSIFLLLKALPTIPPAISNSLPENIVFYDVLGRRHSLQFCYFKEWSVFEAMVKTVFQDCPGFTKVVSGRFEIIDTSFPERRINQSNWKDSIRPRARISMSVHITCLKTVNFLCAKCGGTLRRVGASSSACQKCGLFCQNQANNVKAKIPPSLLIALSSACHECGSFCPSQVRRTKTSRDILRKIICSQTQWTELREPPASMGVRIYKSGSAFVLESQTTYLEVPKSIAHRPLGGPSLIGKGDREDLAANIIGYQSARQAELDRLRTANADIALANAFQTDKISEESEINSWPAISASEASPNPLPSKETAGRDEGSKNVEGFDTFEFLEENWEEGKSTDEVFDPSEEQEFKYFQTISIRDDSRLHDLALEGRYEQVKELLCQGMEINHNLGAWGPALSAAVISYSDDTVQLLLDRGADPLLQAGPLQSPLQTAALLGTTTALLAILDAACRRAKESGDVGDQFQRGLDASLFAAVDVGCLDSVRILLYHGANPFVATSDKRTAISISVSRKMHSVTLSFVMEAKHRSLIEDYEARVLIDSVDGTSKLESSLVPGSWLDSCCRDLQRQRTSVLERQVTQRLSTNFYQIPRKSDISFRRSVSLEYLQELMKATVAEPLKNPSPPPIITFSLV